MKTLIVRYPDDVRAMIISHISVADENNWNMGMCNVTTPILEKGEIEIDRVEVIDNQTGEKI